VGFRFAHSVNEHGECFGRRCDLLKGNERHGPIDTCPIAQIEDLALEYLRTAEGSPARKRLEQRLGRVNIRRLIKRYEEDKANLKWLATSATQCPGCNCYVEKSMGCNHVKI
jgi:E3 ubiquitin-protein ligase RNF14